MWRSLPMGLDENLAEASPDSPAMNPVGAGGIGGLNMLVLAPGSTDNNSVSSRKVRPLRLTSKAGKSNDGGACCCCCWLKKALMPWLVRMFWKELGLLGMPCMPPIVGGG